MNKILVPRVYAATLLSANRQTLPRLFWVHSGQKDQNVEAVCCLMSRLNDMYYVKQGVPIKCDDFVFVFMGAINWR